MTSTDTGHQAQGTDARWALHNLERQVNFAYAGGPPHRRDRQIPRARSIYSRDPHHAYFDGCSTGGRQALMEAQRFPDDFDGIVSGAPVFDWTRVLVGRPEERAGRVSRSRRRSASRS